jgi:hypothetical protein
MNGLPEFSDPESVAEILGVGCLSGFIIGQIVYRISTRKAIATI